MDRKTVKVRFAIYAQKQKDGSIINRVHRRRDIAETDASFDHNRSPGDVSEHELEVDCETGEIIGGQRLTVINPTDVVGLVAVNLQNVFPVKGKTFAFAGTLSLFTRAGAEYRVAAAGGKVSKAISPKTDYVVADGRLGPKLVRAKQLGLTILDENTFVGMTTIHE